MALYIFWLACTLPLVQSYSNGLVTESCADMLPRHGANAQTNSPPYTVTASSNSFANGNQITVTLASSKPFEGFMLQARPVGRNEPVGNFTLVSQSTQLLDCNGAFGTAVTHTSSAPKTNIQATWNAGTAGILTDIQFRATFVQVQRTFWVQVQSAVISYSNKNAFSAVPCGVTEVCFSNPSGCDPALSSSCSFMSAMPIAGAPGAYRFEMTGPTVGYVAMGFSDDQAMGNDDIYICGIDANGLPRLQHAHSTGRVTPDIIALGNVTNVTAAFTNGIISCSFNAWSPNISSQIGISPNITSYFLLFAYGPSINGNIQRHTNTFISNTRVDLSSPLAVQTSTAQPPIIKAHGSLMLIAWMTTGSLGMIIARYMKDMAKGNQFCGKDLWFLVHVSLMILTVAATIIAFILAFVYVAGWAGDAGSHPVLGVLVMILAFFQPFSALFRCGPQHRMRFVFNWAHTWNAVFIKFLAVAAIFTGLQLFDVPDGWLMKVMGGFVGWELILFISMDLQSRCKKRHIVEGRASETESMDWIILVIYFLGNLAFLVALLYGIGR